MEFFSKIERQLDDMLARWLYRARLTHTNNKVIKMIVSDKQNPGQSKPEKTRDSDSDDVSTFIDI